MFKKLFISLLILSALASEGIVNFPANFYNMYLADSSKLDFYEDKNLICLEKLNTETENSENSVNYVSSLEMSSGGLFLLSSNTTAYFSMLKPFNNSYTTLYCNLHEGIGFVIQEEIPFYGEIFAVCNSRDIIIKSSDNSPPLYSKQYGL